MGNIWVAGISTVFEPRTAASATAVFAGIIGGATLGTRFATPCFRWTRRHGWFCGSAGVNATKATLTYAPASRCYDNDFCDGHQDNRVQ